MTIVVYTLPICPNCEHLKELLKKNDIEFEVKDLEDEDVRLELLINSVTLIEAPIVEINGSYFNMSDAIRNLI